MADYKLVLKNGELKIEPLFLGIPLDPATEKKIIDNLKHSKTKNKTK
jgi:hypothetical protein